MVGVYVEYEIGSLPTFFVHRSGRFLVVRSREVYVSWHEVPNRGEKEASIFEGSVSNHELFFKEKKAVLSRSWARRSVEAIAM